MSPLLDRLFNPAHAFDHPVSLWITVGVAAALIATPILIAALAAARVVSAEHRAKLLCIYRSWLILAPAMLIPVLLGAGYTILAVTALSLLCYREFARATGLGRHRLLSAIVTIGILALFIAAADNWYKLFVAIPALTVTALAGLGVLQDQPSGYLQRISLGTTGFILFGVCFAHLAYIANDPDYRPILCMIFACAQAADVSAYMFGKALGRRKLFPHTSPNKTLAGHLGALVVTVALAAWLGRLIFPGTDLDHPAPLIALGLIIAVGAQLGDLMLSSIKRDLGLKDFASTLPGHGGFTDRFNSLLLIAPAVFHFVNYFVGIGDERPPRVLF